MTVLKQLFTLRASRSPSTPRALAAPSRAVPLNAAELKAVAGGPVTGPTL